MGEGGEEKGRRFSPSALSLFRFHLSPFPPKTPDTQARMKSKGREMPETDIFKDAFHPRTV